MIRLEGFDSLNQHKRAILRILANGRELNLREITELAGKSRSCNWSALRGLTNTGFVTPTKATSKRMIKPHWSEKVKRLNRERVLFVLTENGKYAVEYYFGNFSGGVSG